MRALHQAREAGAISRQEYLDALRRIGQEEETETQVVERNTEALTRNAQARQSVARALQTELDAVAAQRRGVDAGFAGGLFGESPADRAERETREQFAQQQREADRDLRDAQARASQLIAAGARDTQAFRDVEQRGSGCSGQEDCPGTGNPAQ